MWRRSAAHDATSPLWATIGGGVYEDWRFNASGGSVRSSAALGTGARVFIGSNAARVVGARGGLWALSQNGSLIWTRSVTSYVTSSPALWSRDFSYESVFVGTMDGLFISVNALDGALRWNVSAAGPVESSPTLFHVNGVPRVFFGASGNSTSRGAGGGGTLYSFDATTAARNWASEYPGNVASSPAVDANGRLFVGTSGGDGAVYSVNATNGALLWRAEAGGSVISSPLVDVSTESGRIFVGSLNSAVGLLALNASSGARLWSFPVGGGVASSPALCTNGSATWATRETAKSPRYAASTDAKTVYFGARNGSVFALNATSGEVVWQFKTGGIVDSSPAIGADCTVYIGAHDGYVRALNGSTGAQLWIFNAGSTVESSPSITADGKIVFGSWGGAVFALRGDVATPTSSASRSPLPSRTSYPTTDLSPSVSLSASTSPHPSASPSASAAASPSARLSETPTASEEPSVSVTVTRSAVSRSWSPSPSALLLATATPSATLGLNAAYTPPPTLSPTSTRTAVRDGGSGVGPEPFAPWPQRGGGATRHGLATDSASAQANFNVRFNSPAVLWALRTGGAIIVGAVVDSYGQVFFAVDASARGVGGYYKGAAPGALLAVDGSTGLPLWDVYASAGLRGTPVRGAGDAVYAGLGGALAAIAVGGVRAAATRWSLTPAPAGTTWLDAPPRFQYSSPALSRAGVLFVASASYWVAESQLRAVSATSGAVIWTIDLPGVALTAAPALSADEARVFIGTDDGRVLCASAANGTVLWGAVVGTAVVHAGVVVTPGGLVLAVVDASLVALAVSDGTRAWSFDAGPQAVAAVEPALAPGPAVNAHGVIAWPYGRALHALSAGGLLMWKHVDAAAPFTSSPAFSADSASLWVGTIDGRLLAFAAAGGLIATVPLDGSAVTAQPALGGDGVVYVGSTAGSLFAIGAVRTSSPTTSSSSTALGSRSDTATVRGSSSAVPSPSFQSSPSATTSTSPSAAPTALSQASLSVSMFPVATTTSLFSVTMSATISPVPNTNTATGTLTATPALPTRLYRKFERSGGDGAAIARSALLAFVIAAVAAAAQWA